MFLLILKIFSNDDLHIKLIQGHQSLDVYCEPEELRTVKVAASQFIALNISWHSWLLWASFIAKRFCFMKYKVKVKVTVRVLSLDPKLALTTSQFYLAGH